MTDDEIVDMLTPLDFDPDDVQFVPPSKGGALEVAITPDGGRLLRSSRERHVAIILTETEWRAHIDSIRAGQTY